MPKLACRTCGRQIYTAAPVTALVADERRCPRCGAYLDTDRRGDDRRSLVRRVNPPALPGPPAGTLERRVADRRAGRRRRGRPVARWARGRGGPMGDGRLGAEGGGRRGSGCGSVGPRDVTRRAAG